MNFFIWKLLLFSIFRSWYESQFEHNILSWSCLLFLDEGNTCVLSLAVWGHSLLQTVTIATRSLSAGEHRVLGWVVGRASLNLNPVPTVAKPNFMVYFHILIQSLQYLRCVAYFFLQWMFVCPLHLDICKPVDPFGLEKMSSSSNPKFIHYTSRRMI